MKAKDPILDCKTHHHGSDTDSEDKWENVIPDEITVNDNTTDKDDRNVMELDGAEMNESGEETFYEIEREENVNSRQDQSER